MSKMLKGILVGLTIIIIGGVIAVVSFASLGWDFNALDTATYTQKSFEVEAEKAETLSRVEIGVNSFPVVVKTGDGLKLDYYDASNSNITVSFEDGVLKIREKTSFSFFRNGFINWGLKRRNLKYELTLPSGKNVDFVLNGSNNNVNLGGLSGGKLTVDASNLDLTLTGCTFTEGHIDSSNADISVEGGQFDTLTVESSNLTFDMKNSSCRIFKLDGSNLDATVSYSTFTNATMEGSNADVDVLHVTLVTLSIDGSNLDADIVLIGDEKEYSVETHGHGRFPSDREGTDPIKKVTVSGSNASVSLSFLSE